MSVILGSEIARLVFGYLQEEQLDEAGTAFCKTSPYLVEEYDWLQRGYKAYKISDLCLVDIIREHCEIKYAVAEYIESLPLSMCETLKTQKSLSGKINSIFDLLTNPSKPNSLSRKRPYSMIGSNSTEATQSNDLPGYEPPIKERRLSRKLILRDSTPKQNSIWTPTFKQNVQEAYVSDDQDEENTSPEQTNSLEKSRNETSQYPIFTETILENTQFQNVLVENINRILETSTDRIDASVESGSHEMMSHNNSLQDQVKHAIDNIILSTEQDPTFQQVLNDVVQHTAIQEQTTRTTSLNDMANNSIGKTNSPVPLKQRLRNRSQDKPRPNYTEIDQSSKKKRKGKVEVISNEIVSGEISDLLHSNTTARDSYVPLNQILYLNSEKSSTTFGQDLVYVNVGVPTFPPFRIDADTPMFLQDISLQNNGPSTSLAPGSIINLPTMEQQIQPIQSMLPHVIIKDIADEVSKTKPIERSIKTTPSVSKNLIQAKARNLSTPRRQSHVRSLNFATSDDFVNETERKRNENDEKSEAVNGGSASKPQTTLNSEISNDDSDRKASLEEAEQQQDSSDAVDFSKEFDEATVISVELSPAETANSECSKEENPGDSEKKKPQTRQQCQKDLEMWKQMRQMKKGEWDNYLRQTVASTTGRAPGDKKKFKKRRSKICAKSNAANVSAESVSNTTTEIEAKLLEEALQSAKKTVPPVINNSSTPEITKEVIDPAAQMKPSSIELKPSSSTAVTAQRSDVKNPRSPNKRSSGGRKQLIQIKLPASAKKKQLIMSKYRKAKPIIKRTVKPPVKSQKPPAETSRIDPSKTIDIDLISPIEYPKEVLSNVVKSGVNLNSFLETPYKESPSFKFPITPGFAVSSSIKTPVVRLIKEYDSLIKFPEYPTPSFAITPGRTKTPVSQSSSQKDGSSYNRATDYSSGSSYYKPDESDDIDKNLDVLIKENRAQMIVGGLGVDPQLNINFCDDQAASEGECSDTSSSTSSSSQSSSTSTCSSSPSNNSTLADDGRNDAQTSKDTCDTKKLLLAQRTQNQFKLEQVRLRTMATLKTDKKIERFRKPKTKIAALQRHKVIDGSAQMMKKPVQTLKMTGNSTPKIVPKVLPKNVNKLNPRIITATPSKRKIATPRRVIYLDYKDAVKTSVRIVSHGDRKQVEQIPSQSNSKTKLETLKPVQETNQQRSATPTETIDAIENHIAKTSDNSFVDGTANSTTDNQVDTPNLLQQLQGKSETTENASTPEMGPPATSTKRASLVRELFGDGAMSDSDFMDTPIKPTNNSRTQKNVVPISNAINEVSTDSITNESTVMKAVPNLSKINDKLLIVADSGGGVSDAMVAIKNSVTPDSKTNESKTNELDTKDKDSKPDDLKATGIKSKKSSSDEPNAKESIDKNVNEKELILKDSSSKGSKSSSSKKSASKDNISKNLSSKESRSDEPHAKESIDKDVFKEDSILKDSSSKCSKSFSSKKSASKDNISKNSSSKDLSSDEPHAKESIDKDVNEEDLILKDSSSKNSGSKKSASKDSNIKDSSPKVSSSKGSQAKKSIDKDVKDDDLILKDSSFKGSKISSSKKSASKDPSIKDSSPKVSRSKEPHAKESIDKDVKADDLILKDSSSKKTSSKDSSWKNSSSKDSSPNVSTSKDSIVEDSIAEDSISTDAISKDSIFKNFNAQDSLITSKDSVDKDSNAKVSVADVLTAAERRKVDAESIRKIVEKMVVDSSSESDDDDDYDACSLISSLPVPSRSNRIYHNVISETIECAIKPNIQSLDMRPLTTFLDDRKIVVQTCDEIILYSSAPKTDSRQAASSTPKSLVNNRKSIKMVQSVKKKVDTEQRQKKVQKPSSDGTDGLAPEKNARFNIVAKQKGPVEASSSHTSSSRDQRKILSPSDKLQPNAGTSNEMKTSSQNTKIPPLLKDMDINKVLGKIHPSKETA